MRYRVRTLLLLLAVGPPVLAWCVPPLVEWATEPTPMIEQTGSLRPVVGPLKPT